MGLGFQGLRVFRFRGEGFQGCMVYGLGFRVCTLKHF